MHGTECESEKTNEFNENKLWLIKFHMRASVRDAWKSIVATQTIKMTHL